MTVNTYRKYTATKFLNKTDHTIRHVLCSKVFINKCTIIISFTVYVNQYVLQNCTFKFSE